MFKWEFMVASNKKSLLFLESVPVILQLEKGRRFHSDNFLEIQETFFPCKTIMKEWNEMTWDE